MSNSRRAACCVGVCLLIAEPALAQKGWFWRRTPTQQDERVMLQQRAASQQRTANPFQPYQNQAANRPQTPARRGFQLIPSLRWRQPQVASGMGVQSRYQGTTFQPFTSSNRTQMEFEARLARARVEAQMRVRQQMQMQTDAELVASRPVITYSGSFPIASEQSEMVASYEHAQNQPVMLPREKTAMYAQHQQLQVVEATEQRTVASLPREETYVMPTPQAQVALPQRETPLLHVESAPTVAQSTPTVEAGTTVGRLRPRPLVVLPDLDESQTTARPITRVDHVERTDTKPARQVAPAKVETVQSQEPVEVQPTKRSKKELNRKYQVSFPKDE